jgi:hypothetical protein
MPPGGVLKGGVCHARLKERVKNLEIGKLGNVFLRSFTLSPFCAFPDFPVFRFFRLGLLRPELTVSPTAS